MSKHTNISVVIPAYNEEDILADCIESVLAQRRPADEIIVVDNNSTDRTAEIAQSYRQVSYMNETEQGIVHSRPAGMKTAKCEIIATLDADSLAHPDWLQVIEAAFQDKTVSGWSSHIGFHDVSQGLLHKPVRFLSEYSFNWFAFTVNRFISRAPMLFGSNYAVRKQDWLQIEPKLRKHKDVWEDLDTALALQWKQKRVVNESRKLVDISVRSAYAPIRHFAKRMLVEWPNTYKGYRKRGKVLARIAGMFALAGNILIKAVNRPPQKH